MLAQTIDKPITPNDLEFLSYWLINEHNASKAYQRVHPNASPETAKVEGCRILTKPNVKAEISRRMAELAQETGWSVEIALKKLKKIIISAETSNQLSAAVSAVVAANRMFGLDKDSTSDREIPELNAIEKAEARRLASIVLVQVVEQPVVKPVESEVVESEM